MLAIKSSMESLSETPSAAHAHTDVYADHGRGQTGGVRSCIHSLVLKGRTVSIMIANTC